MDTRRVRPLRLLAAACLLAPSVWHVAYLASVIHGRLSFPDDIDPLEGGHVYQAWRILHGLPLYASPASGFVPFPYPPLYWAVVAAAGAIFGVSHATARAVSVVCVGLATAILAVAAVRRAPTRAIAVVMAVGLPGAVAAGYSFCLDSYDLARNDSMTTLTIVAALGLAGDGKLSLRRAVGVAVVLSAAVFTKQTALAFAVVLVAYCTWRDRRGGLALLLATGVIIGAGVAGLSVGSSGWFTTWFFDQGRHEMHLGRWPQPLADLLPYEPFMPAIPVLAWWLSRRGTLSAETLKWSVAWGTATVVACIVRVKEGSDTNLNAQAVVLGWPVAAMLLGDWLRGLGARDARARVGWLMLIAGSVGMLFLAFGTPRFVPRSSDWRPVAALDEYVRSLDGCVVVANKPMVAVRTGKSCPQPMLRAYTDAACAGMDVSYADALVTDGAAWVIVIDPEREQGLSEDLERCFDRVGRSELGVLTPGVPHPRPNSELWKRHASGECRPRDRPETSRPI